MKLRQFQISMLLAVMFSAFSFGQPATQPTEQLHQASLQWFRDAKFGMFIHWGPVSVQGTEIGWSRNAPRSGLKAGVVNGHDEVYDNLYRKFNPVNFDPAEWVRIAQETGMKYMVFTTRHHDGFSNYDTKQSDYKITSPNSPYGKDIVKQLADACHAAKFPIGFYYSQPNWYHPDAFTEHHDRFVKFVHEQVRELLTNYGPVCVVWFDGLHVNKNTFGAVEMHKMIRELQPQILINNRDGLPEDFDTPEQHVGKMQVDRPWETCMTICDQWAWKPDGKLKSLDECIGILVTTVTGDGNLLLNVGPMPDGRIEPRQVERLKEIGAWVKDNSEAIYDTRGGPWVNGKWGGSTYRGDALYIHLLQAPPDGKLKLPAYPGTVTAASELVGGKAVQFSLNQNGLTLDLPESEFHAPATVVKLTVSEPVKPGQMIGASEALKN